MAKNLATFNNNIAIGNIESYISWANSIPVLSPQEESDLAKQLHENQDIDAAKKLILHNLKFVIHVARGYSGYSLPLADLIQEGNMGLMKAIKKFNPTKGVRLISYAIHWIKSEIHEYVIRNFKGSGMTIATKKEQRKLFFNLNSLKQKLTKNQSLNKNEITLIANKLNVPEKEVVVMEQRMLRDVSFDMPTMHSDQDEDQTLCPENIIPDDTSNQCMLLEQHTFETQRAAKLRTVLDKMDMRERTIIEKRWLQEKKVTLQNLAKELGLSTERVRQLEAKTLEKMQHQLLEIKENS